MRLYPTEMSQSLSQSNMLKNIHLQLQIQNQVKVIVVTLAKDIRKIFNFLPIFIMNKLIKLVLKPLKAYLS